MLRRCGRCRKHKPPDEFAWRRKAKGQRDNYCKPCRAAYKKEHYAKNRDRYIANAGVRKQAAIAKWTEYVAAYLNEHPCVDCGEDDIVVLEFDHVRGRKRFGIAAGVRTRSWTALIAEMDKCDVVCANCHRRRTARAGRFARAIYAQTQNRAGEGN